MLERAIERLRREPTLGIAYDMISPGLRRYSAERHRIFFREHGDELVIVRVLHEAQDVGQQPFERD